MLFEGVLELGRALVVRRLEMVAEGLIGAGHIVGDKELGTGLHGGMEPTPGQQASNLEDWWEEGVFEVAPGFWHV